ncbi:hypothetical protein B0A49_11040 [Cryomyces minteri]|uniref:Large ribosomal subunit protein bL27m n=1 Tax=Cryomyces minteri TaxID=331657 RepID=A0A4U0WIG8_9PEZI|nr:hypothetical protein B0A49_11040 [Cryomyces minteri]
MRSRKVRPEYLSEHAIRLHFDYARVGIGYALRLSDAPLKETHSFATIANPERQNGFSVVISNAGDWTKRIIQKPPDRLWVRGTPTIGVLRVALLFECVVIVATGSGIGPCLSLFNSKPDHPVRILWSTPNPEATYGKGIIDAVLRADPNAVIVDTRKTGRVDMVSLTYSLYEEANAEAVVIISNPSVTRKVVYEQYVIPGNIIFRQRGTHWFPGDNCDMGRDHTIYATQPGYVKYYRDPLKHPKRQYIGVVFQRHWTLPQPPNAARKRRLGMLAVKMEESESGQAVVADMQMGTGEEGNASVESGGARDTGA